MKCRKCGAELLNTDTFCIQCGQRVDGPMLCLSCGEQLREGERFCHHCGIQVETAAEEEEIPVSVQNTIDIPFDQIEQGILLEAKQAVVKRPSAEKRSKRSLNGGNRNEAGLNAKSQKAKEQRGRIRHTNATLMTKMRAAPV